MSRQAHKLQLIIGQTPISDIKIDFKSRDDIPRVLMGLQYIYKTESIREPIFKLLEEKILPDVDKNNGRPGMELWKILVLGVLRLDLNCDYDRVHELANQHKSIRQMLGHSEFFDDEQYSLQAIKDNIRHLTPELLHDINLIIVKAGHVLLDKKKVAEPLRGRCDSFVVETHVHYPTDINLLFDAVRKVIQLTAKLADGHHLSDWRQHAHNVRQVKGIVRAAQQKKRRSGKTEEQKLKNVKIIKEAHDAVIKTAQGFLNKSDKTISELTDGVSLSVVDFALMDSIKGFKAHAERQIDQIERRVLEEQTIPHGEKVFSIFQPHTEWVSKGKAGVPVEFGVKVCILEEQHKFILHHQVMETKMDDVVAVPMVTETKRSFPHLTSCSFDKGFHSPRNQKELSDHLDVVAMKRKGKPSKEAQKIEGSEVFKHAHHKHSAVESAINALEVHGLDKCKDHGIDGFKRYVSLAIVSRNIHRIGDLIFQKEKKKEDRRRHKDPIPIAA